MTKKLLSGLYVLGLLSGCAHYSAGVSPSTEPLAPGSYQEIEAVRGKDCAYSLLGVIPLTNGNETKDAVADAVQQVPGATALVKVSADTYAHYFILFSTVCTQVDGVAVAPK